MEPEDSIPQDEGQGQNPYPGRSEGRANTAYNLPDVKGLANKYRGAKNMAKNAKRVAKTAKKAVETAQKARKAYAAAQAAYAAAAAVVGTSEIWVPILIVLLVIIVLLAIFNMLNAINPFSSSNAQLTSSGPVQAKIGDKLDYTINIAYPGTAQDIIITNQIPAGTKYINAPLASYDPTTNTATWSMAEINSSSSTSLVSNINTTLSLTLLATKNDGYIVNVPKATVVGEVLGENNFTITPTIFHTSPADVLGENDSQFSTINITPTIFQKTPDINVISNCVITKIGEPAITPPLPPECTNF